MRLAVDKARNVGVGIVTVYNSGHFGAIGHYAVQAASFPLDDTTREGRGADARLDLVTSRLQALGYTPWVADVELKAGGEWRRVLIGEFPTLDEATRQAEHLRQTKEFADAYPIRY